MWQEARIRGWELIFSTCIFHDFGRHGTSLRFTWVSSDLSMSAEDFFFLDRRLWFFGFFQNHRCNWLLWLFTLNHVLLSLVVITLPVSWTKFQELWNHNFVVAARCCFVIYCTQVWWPRKRGYLCMWSLNCCWGLALELEIAIYELIDFYRIPVTDHSGVYLRVIVLLLCHDVLLVWLNELCWYLPSCIDIQKALLLPTRG